MLKELETTDEGIIVIDYIIEYEAGNLDEYDTCVLFQHLVNTGQAWTLQGSYGRTATDLLDAGLIQPAFMGEEY